MYSSLRDAVNSKRPSTLYKMSMFPKSQVKVLFAVDNIKSPHFASQHKLNKDYEFLFSKSFSSLQFCMRCVRCRDKSVHPFSLD